MQKLFGWIETKLVPPLLKVGEQKHLKGIRDGLVATLPFIIIGSIFMIIRSFPIPGWTDLIASFRPALYVPCAATFDMLAIIAVLAIGYNLAKEREVEPMSGAILSLIAFLITQINEENAIVMDNFGASGMFTAIVVALISIEIFRFFVQKKIIIKLPENVPPAIANSFIALLPGTAIMTLFWVIRVVLGFDLTAFINLIFSPLVFALDTLPGLLVFILIMCLLWTVGLHGDSIVGAIASPISLAYLGANQEAFAAGAAIPYINAKGFTSFFVNSGGTGMVLALILLMVFSKSRLYKQMGRLCLPSGIFNISEPIVFGFPIVMNPIMFIPFILAPLINGGLSYILMDIGLIGRPVVAVTWTMPPVIAHYLVTGGDWRAAIWGAIQIVLAVIIYMPFFRVAEKKQLALEAEEDAAKLANEA